MPDPSDELDDPSLWAAFNERTLSVTHWMHTAHLRVAWLHLARYELDEAHLLMHVGIIRLNATHGLVETAARGYHETLTFTWLRIVHACRARHACDDSLAFVTEHAEALTRSAPLAFYSRELLLSLPARSRFVAPDLATFDLGSAQSTGGAASGKPFE